MTRVLPRWLALLPLLWLSTAGALGLGDIDVRSRLNQRFAGSIPLSALGPDEAASVRVSLASAAEFERAGIERAEFLSALKFTVVNGPVPRIEIASDQIAREPYLSLLLDVRAASGRILREYTVLLDPPELTSRSVATQPTSAASFYETADEASKPSAAAPALTPAPRVEAPKPKPQPAPAVVAVETPADDRARTTGESSQYGPIQSGETFWSIAKRLKPDDGVTMDQMLLAIYQANPAAFDGFNGLRRGSTLIVPDLATIRATSAEEAKREVTRLRGGRAAAPAATSPAVAVAKPEPIAAPSPKPAVVAEAPKLAVTPAVVEPPPASPPSAETVTTTTPPVESPSETPVTTPVADASVEPAAGEPASAEPSTPAAEPAAVEGDEIASAPIREEEAGGLVESLLIPLILGLMLLGAIGFAVSKILAARRNKAEEPLSAAPRIRIPGRDPANLAAPVAAAAVAGGVAESRRSAKEELERLQESLDEAPGAVTQQLSTQQFDLGNTQAVPPADATQMFEASPAAAPAPADVDFDLTGQFEAQTVQINLDANDPVSEADFHLAYGLYDEAALLLKQAAAKDPARTDVPVKLAETYFAAGRPEEFRQVAEALQGRASAAEWQKIVIMGQQLSPGAALYASRDDQASSEMAVDLSFDDAPSPASEPLPAAEAYSPRAEADAALDFKLEDLELPSLDQDEPPAAKPAAGGNSVEFDLSSFDLDTPVPPPAPSPQPKVPAAPVAEEPDNLLDFDLGGDAEPAPVVSEAQPLDLDEFEFGDLGEDSSTISGDESGTKLDLARAYVDMGDNEMARTLLNEVLEQGSEQQQQEARTLIGRLS